MNVYKNIVLFFLKPLIWFLNIFNKQIENLFFINEELINLFKKNFLQLNFLQRIILILSYKGNNFKTTTLLMRNINYVNYYRLKNYPIIHNFILKNYINKNNLNKLKIKNFLNQNLYSKSFTEKSILFNMYLNTFNNNLFWKNFFFSSSVSFNLTKNYFILNLNLINDFYLFLKNVNLNLLNDIFYKSIITSNDEKIYRYKTDEKYYLKLLNSYNSFYRGLDNNFKNKIFYEIADILFKYSKIITNKSFLEDLKKVYSIKFKPTDITQYLKKNNFKKNTLNNLFIRKNKIFNKGRYSRNRQLYRTGVYWCLWMNIIAVFGLYYYFYRFVFNFGYMYLPLLILILSIFGSRLVKYRLYNITNVINELLIFFKILESFIRDFILNNFIKLFNNAKLFLKNLKIIFYYLK